MVYYRYITFYEDGSCIVTQSLEKSKKILTWFRRSNLGVELRKNSRRVEGGNWILSTDRIEPEEREIVHVQCRTFDNDGTYFLKFKLFKRDNEDCLRMLDYHEVTDRGKLIRYDEITSSMTSYYHYNVKRKKNVPIEGEDD